MIFLPVWVDSVEFGCLALLDSRVFVGLLCKLPGLVVLCDLT